jgi:glycosyltransferase involved in cell wall biosynthesis
MMLLFYIFCVCTGIQALFALSELWFSAATNDSNSRDEESSSPVSIIVCARNEAGRLKVGLPLLLAQDISTYEVLLVDDCSNDDTAKVAAEWAIEYPQLRLIRISADEARQFPGKKQALSIALQHARYEHLLLCDADCHPQSRNWARIMTAPLLQGKEIVAGYGAYEYRPGLLNAFIRWETLHTFLQYSTFGRIGLPYMAVGRNLACRKHLLQEAQEHPLWRSMPSGDDDLLIRLKGTRHNYTTIADPEACTASDAPAGYSDWLAQKQRHVSTGKLYRKPVQLLLATYAGTHAFMWITFILLICSDKGYLVLSPMLLRCFLTWSIWIIAARKMKERKLILYFPFTDFLWLLYHTVLSPFIFFKNKQKWT